MAIIRSVFLALYAIVFTIGLPSNTVILAGYSKKKKKIGTDIFIMGLAIADLLSSVICLLKFKVWVASDLYCKSKWYLNICLFSCQMMMTMVISFDRYLAVCFPVHRRPTVRRAVIIVVIAYLVGFLVNAPNIVAIHYDDFIKDCMYRSDINWFIGWDKYFGQGYVMTCVFTPFLLYCRVIFVLRRQSKVHARLVTNVITAPPSTRMAVSQLENIKGPKTTTTSSICNEGGQTAGPKALNEDGTGQPKDQTDQSVVHTNLGSMHSEGLDESQANGLPVLTNHGAPHTGNVEDVSGKHRKTTASTDATDAAPVVVVASSQTETKCDQNANVRLSEKKLTVMLGTVTGIYLTSMIPLLIGRYIPIETRRTFMNRSDVHHTIYSVLFNLYEINTTINLFVYWQLNRGFRQDCQEIFRKVKRVIFKK